MWLRRFFTIFRCNFPITWFSSTPAVSVDPAETSIHHTARLACVAMAPLSAAVDRDCVASHRAPLRREIIRLSHHTTSCGGGYRGLETRYPAGKGPQT